MPGQRSVTINTGWGVALQELAAISGEKLQRMFLAAAGNLMEQHNGRIGTAMAATIGYGGPEVTASCG